METSVGYPTLGVVVFFVLFFLKQPVTGRCSSGYDLRNESPAARRVVFSSFFSVSEFVFLYAFQCR